MNGGGAASGVSAAEGRGAAAFCTPRRAGKKEASAAQESFGATSGPRVTQTEQSMSRVEQLVTRESHDLAEAGELARRLTSKSSRSRDEGRGTRA